MGRQQGHALMAAGLDQAGHQKRIQHPLGLALAHCRREGGAIARRRQGPQGDATALQQLQHLLEVLQFLAGQGAEHLPQLPIAGIAEHQLQGHTGGLALAVGVVDQHQIRMGDCLGQPGGTAGGSQPLHPGRGAQTAPRRWATRPSRARV